MLVENYMNSPSSFEGFLSIPVNLVKAFVAITAQLFNFKIQHQYQNEITTLNTQKKLPDLRKQAGDVPKNLKYLIVARLFSSLAVFSHK